MYFFRASNSTDSLNALHNLLKKKPDLQAWWQVARDKNAWSFLYSHQTKQLDASIAKLSRLIENYQIERAQERLKALQKLYLQVCNWQHMHIIKRQDSDRKAQVEVLASWLKDQLGKESAFQIERKENPYAGVEISDQHLYQWWKAMSKLGWFCRRSTATQELDKAIHWFSNSIIIDRVKGLQELMAAIEVWKDERGEVSRRLPMVEALQSYIANQISELEDREYTENSYLPFSIRSFALITGCYIQELFEAFDGIFEISSLLFN
ncbi:hypothetical protein [Legionella hackeliae]|uniref:Uncharacterized protein n=1 Tax=Legionella hackeliae TaxID=449 RepID=A0A0A8UNY1_LEGHA|nr:hypothetical protein [Legionella hackeliae]KTD12898.1 hypothetical protein Lhac_1769 [Legionella hackeliae]CEK09206.1 protein of unknown function [Legionella hackeliae]STX49114.1 Uncharacterised protein [Legionella hackeliae]